MEIGSARQSLLALLSSRMAGFVPPGSSALPPPAGSITPHAHAAPHFPDRGFKGVMRYACEATALITNPRISPRTDLELRELDRLAPYAAKSMFSRGRVEGMEEKNPFLTDFQVDVERISVSFALRRLMRVRQVAHDPSNIYNRTRYAHTMEVAHPARILAQALRLNADLAEAAALAHDIGHPPFGHDGEIALNEMMEKVGLRFEHNVHGYRKLRRFTHFIPQQDWLNPTLELLYCVALHTSSYDRPHHGQIDIDIPRMPPLEGQVVNVADEMAYIAHDTDDALQAGIISLEQIGETALAGALINDGLRSKRDPVYLRNRLKVDLTDALRFDVLSESARRIAAAKPDSIMDVYDSSAPMIGFSERFVPLKEELRQFLFKNVYTAGECWKRAQIAREMIKALFGHYVNRLNELPEYVRGSIKDKTDEKEVYSKVCDFIADMDDEQAEKDYHRIFG